MRRRRLALAVVPVLLLAGCSKDKSASPPTPAPVEEPSAVATTIPSTPVVARIVLPETGSVPGTGGRGAVIVLTFKAVDPAALPAQFRVGGDLPPPAAPAKFGHNPAFPGLVVGTTTTPASLGGPSANLANLFQVVSPAVQSDGSVLVTAVWTNAQVSLGSDVDVTIGALTVSGTAPDLIPQPLTDLRINSNVAGVTVHLSAGESAGSGAAGASTSTTTTTAPSRPTTTTRGATTSTTRPGGSTTTTTRPGGPTSTTIRTTTTTAVRPTTSTTRFLGLL